MSASQDTTPRNDIGNAPASAQDQLNRRVLFVDDESNILDSFRRTLRKRFDVTTASGPLSGLDTIRDHPAFAVVVSDLRMPKMNGVEFLSRVRSLSPDSVRIMLTAHADVEAAVAAVNDGAVFRFLTKPCQTETLIRAIEAGMEHYRLVNAERDLLRGTLRGSINVLTEVLALTNPEAFGRSQRIKGHMSALAKRFDRPDAWKLDLAAMLSQIGCVTLTSDMLHKKLAGGKLSADEKELLANHPDVGYNLLKHIPRLHDVAEMVRQQNTSLSENRQISFGARALKILLDYDARLQSGAQPDDALNDMLPAHDVYDSTILLAFAEMIRGSAPRSSRQLYLEDLRPGMVTAQNIETRDGTLLATAGQELSDASVSRIRNFARAYGLDEPLSILHSPDTEE
ncbi:HD domain-containing phosphohydrolase [Desulfovibrio psychrotolerans]|uniref:Response regulatory domain-containing protein n=1 Tax=Desulfovibrio psychrotolerans TaxID=415242 RepID=A0A7J0BR87_9BACT|nr:HD domain-containing phosphohydrolase [Desulfovibrio psychrotolerans]GFM36199.1 hypothetical protein DSM19430T_08830 [Desulfovibrio psychrotolerans]